MFQKRTLRLPAVTKYFPSSEKASPYTLEVILFVATLRPVYRGEGKRRIGDKSTAENLTVEANVN